MAYGQGTKRKWPEGRKDPRVPARIELNLRKADGSDLGEILFTENVCRGGVGLFTGNFWRPNQEVLLRALRLGFTARGRIVYCHRVADRHFAVGIAVFSNKADWGA